MGGEEDEQDGDEDRHEYGYGDEGQRDSGSSSAAGGGGGGGLGGDGGVSRMASPVMDLDAAEFDFDAKKQYSIMIELWRKAMLTQATNTTSSSLPTSRVSVALLGHWNALTTIHLVTSEGMPPTQTPTSAEGLGEGGGDAGGDGGGNGNGNGNGVYDFVQRINDSLDSTATSTDEFSDAPSSIGVDSAVELYRLKRRSRMPKGLLFNVI